MKDYYKILIYVFLVNLGKYLKNMKNIIKEYSWVPLKKYKEGRLKVLCYFLNKPNIYNTKIFRKKYEQKARNNLKRSIQKLNI